MAQLWIWIPYVLAGIVLLRILTLPMKLVWKLLSNSICGILLLVLVNFLAGFTGFSIPINLFSALIAGTLGFPGLILLGILQFVF